MNLLNSANFIGRIVDESIQAQQISSNSNVVVAYFKIAINKGFIDRQTKQWTDKTQFIPIKAFGAKASYIAKNFNKGDLVALNCEIDVNSKKDEKGEYTTYWSLIVQDIKKLSKSSKIEEISKTHEIALEQNKAQFVDVELAKEKETEEDSPWELDF